MIKKGNIVAIACKDDCYKNLSDKAISWLKDMGSAEIENLGYRDGFAFVGVMGDGEVNEKWSADVAKVPVSVTTVFKLK